MFGVYNKFIIAILTTIGAVLETSYHTAHWSQAITAGIGAFLVYLVPNTPVGTS